MFDGAQMLRVAGANLSVARPAHLVLLELFAGGPADRWDIEQLLSEPEGQEVVAEVEAVLPRLPDEFRALWNELGARRSDRDER